MIIWIASYPRSGNTLTTQVFKQVFDKVCYEKYNNFHNYIKHVSDDKTFSKIGLDIYTKSWEDFYNEAFTSSEIFFIKTHDAPEDNSPCIYVVRNGLNATESFYAYHLQVIKQARPWEEFLIGSVFPFHSWGSHLDSWDPLNRSNTLLIRYEDIISDAETVIAEISEFTGLCIRRNWTNNFAELQKTNPEFFRKGKIDTELSIPDHIKHAFEEINADWLNLLGYNKQIKCQIDSLKILRNLLHKQSIRIQERDKYISILQKQLVDKKSIFYYFKKIFKMQLAYK
jgi:hypothetical protein